MQNKAKKIPIQNIYYMLCYAWDILPKEALVRVASEPNSSVFEFLTSLFIDEMKHLLQRGLQRGYQEKRASSQYIRGKIDFASSIKTLSIQKGSLVCQSDTLTANILPNQIIKSTVQRLLQMEHFSKVTKEVLCQLESQLAGIEVIDLSPHHFVQSGRPTIGQHYPLILFICGLLFDASLPTPERNQDWFLSFLEDRKYMGSVFEQFVFNFYKREQPTFQVTRNIIHWDTDTRIDTKLLPTMRTDITLRNPARTYIIDTKFYSQTLQQFYGKSSFHSKHLYQIFAYLKNYAAKTKKLPHQIEGILLYPTVDLALNYKYLIQGHQVHFITLNLMQPWASIHRDLLTLINLSKND